MTKAEIGIILVIVLSVAIGLLVLPYKIKCLTYNSISEAPSYCLYLLNDK